MNNNENIENIGDHLDEQSGNAWGGLPTVREHKCTDFENEDADKGIIFCGVCGETLREVDYA